MLEQLAWGLGAVGLAAGLVEWWQTRGPQPGTIEYVQERYREGDISLAELERRIDVIEDPEADRIRETVERVSGIGEQTSWDIAAEFDSVDDLREADRDRLEAVPNIGPERARALRDRLRE